MTNQQDLVSASRYTFDALEPRVLLTAAGEIADVTWRGGTVRAVAGEWIVGVERTPDRVVDIGDGPIWLPAITHDTTPLADLRPAFDALESVGITFGSYLGAADVFTIHAPADLRGDDLAALLADLPGFRHVEPNAVFSIDDAIGPSLPTEPTPPTETPAAAPAPAITPSPETVAALAAPTATPAARPRATLDGLFGETAADVWDDAFAQP